MFNLSSSSISPNISPPCLLVIFGASGDLTKRKLIPAIYHLLSMGRLNSNMGIIGTSRSKISDDEFRKSISAELNKKKEKTDLEKENLDSEKISQLLERCFYYSMDPTEGSQYLEFSKFLDKIDKKIKSEHNFLFYLATPPILFGKIPELLFQAGLFQENHGSWRRVIIEKPFGHDLESAKQLNSGLKTVLNENQIYRMDHYLGKETVQNIMVFRFANEIFAPIWNRNYIDSVQITVAETLGVELRAGYYDESGALKDMVPNHLFQLVTLIGMEPPNSLESDDVRDEKVKLLRAIKPFNVLEVRKNTVRGQYGMGKVGDDKVLAYLSEEGISSNSNTETFVAMKLEIENWRWSGVPFYLRTGKRLAEKTTEVVIHFKCPTFKMFRDQSDCEMSSNAFVIKIQPEEKILLRFVTKIPGPELRLDSALMDFDYLQSFRNTIQTGYETLLLDAMRGDSSLFQRADQIEAAWEVVDPILKEWSAEGNHDLYTYAAGSWGPKEANLLLEKDGRSWVKVREPVGINSQNSTNTYPRKGAA